MLYSITWDVDPVMLSLGAFELRYYTLGFLLAFVIGYRVLLKVFLNDKLNAQQLDSFTVYVLVGTILGARLGHCLFYEFDYYASRPWEMLLPFRFGDDGVKFTGFQGLASHGAAIGIIASVALFCKKHKLGTVWLLDRLVIVVALGGMFIRLGNFFNSEIYGLPTSLPWGIVFARIDGIARHPTQLYEAVSYLGIFLGLHRLYWKSDWAKATGRLFGLFLIAVFGVRIFWEFFKENQEAFEDQMRFNMGQLLSVPLVLAGVWFVLKKPKNATSGKA
jgi:phosphatidylglycerol---prolipoprotein diacylglyceryl transferase